MKLIIAEKNELAEASIKYQYSGKKTGEYWTCNDDVFIFATNGHMMELYEPEDYNPALKKWIKSMLPFRNIPYKKRPKKECEGRFKILSELISKADIVIHAGDADDEGQLIVDEILAYNNYKGEVKRVYLTDNTEQGVKKAYSKLIDNALCVKEGYAAEARQVGDQNFGVQMTRLYTCSGQEQGYDGVLNIGRVQTALRGLVVRRDREFESHTKAYYYIVSGEFDFNNQSFKANYKVNPATDPVDEKNRIIDKDFAIELSNKITGKSAKISSLATTKKVVQPPLPYNKAEITAAAAKKFKIKLDVIDKTLEDLRLVHELITYGRSDSRYLSDEIFADSPLRLASIGKNSDELSDIIAKTDHTIKSRAFNNELCAVHHGIIPTQKVADLSKLSNIEREMYLLISRSFIAQFLPNHQFDHTSITIDVENYKFTTSSKLVTENGWKNVFSEVDVEDEENEPEEDSTTGLHLLSNGSTGTCTKGSNADKATKPRPRYTLPTLIKDMNSIAKYVKDETIRNLLKDKDKDNPDLHGSIGTPATQNGIIKEQFKNGYFVEDAKGNILSTDICRDLHDILPEHITNPDITALWYEKQKLIAEGKMTILQFLDEVLADIGKEVERVNKEGIKLNIKKVECPKCGRALKRNKGQYGFWWGCTGYSSGCDAKYKDNKGVPIFEAANSSAAVSTGKKCPECGDDLVTKKGKWTPPKAEKPKAEPSGKKCDKCGKDMVKRMKKDKSGEFLACSGYPECKNIQSI